MVLTLAGCDRSRPSSQPAPPSAPSVQYIPRADNGPQRPFAEAVRVGNMLYLSGQLGDSAGKIVPGGIEAETRRTLENIKAALERNGSSMDNVVKCTAMLADMSEWPAMNAVYATYFTKHFPARSAFGTTGLALGARMELECMATVDSPAIAQSLRGAEARGIPCIGAETRILVPLADALREHWRTAAWLGLASAAAIATLSPVLSLTGTSVLQPSPIRTVDLGLAWTSGAQSPAALPGRSHRDSCSRLLLVIAAAACAVAVVTAAHHSVDPLRRPRRRHRGSPRRRRLPPRPRPELPRRGRSSSRSRRCRWASPPDTSACAWHCAPGPTRSGPGATHPSLVAIVTAIALLLGALLPLRHARGKRLVNLPANPLSLFPPIVQIGASLAILLAATLVSKQATLLIGRR